MENTLSTPWKYASNELEKMNETMSSGLFPIRTDYVYSKETELDSMRESIILMPNKYCLGGIFSWSDL